MTPASVPITTAQLSGVGDENLPTPVAFHGNLEGIGFPVGKGAQ
jgi:hypothetical protein